MTGNAGMKKILALLAALALLFAAIPAMAQEGAEWEFDEYAAPGTLIKYNGPGGDVVVPAEVDGEPIRIISSRAFNGNDTITSLTFPEGVLVIETNAFVGCTSLESITLPQTLQVLGPGAFAFSGCLKELTVPASVRYVGTGALDCGLARVTFEGQLPIISDKMFDYFGPSYGSEAIIVPDNLLDEYRAYFHDNELIVGSGKTAETPDYTTSEADFVFDAATGTITEYVGEEPCVYVPATIGGVPVTAIGDSVFEERSPLYAVVLPEGITHIGKRAFAWDTTYLYVNLPQTLVSIGESAFDTTYFFAEPEFPSSLESIGYRAFRGAVGLNTWQSTAPLTLPEGLKEIGEEAFARAYIEELILPSTIEHIGTHAFADCATTYMAMNCYELPEMDEEVFSGSTLTKLADIDFPWDMTYAQWASAKAAFDKMGFENLTVWRNNPASNGHCFEVDFNDEATKGEYDKNGFLSAYTGTEADLSVYTQINWNDGSVPTIGVGEGTFKGNQAIRTFWPHHCDTFTTISAEAFADSTLEYIEMYDSITTVGSRAFANCTGLTEIVLPEFLTELAPDAFVGCTGITKVDVRCDASLLTPGMFADSANLTEISVAKGSIPAGMFDGQAALAKISLGDGVTAIGARAFADTAIESFVVPSQMDVDYTAFAGATQLTLSAGATDEQVAAWNQALNYPWYDSILREGEASKLQVMPFEPTPAENFEFDKETGTIIKYWGDDVHVVIPREIDGVTVRAIAYGAFGRCEDYTNMDIATNRTEWVRLRSVVIPETVREVGDSLFNHCQQLRTVICYAPLDYASKAMFSNCTQLEDVVFVNGVRNIDNYCFDGAGPLTNLWFGDCVDTIGYMAFARAGVQELTLNAQNILAGAVTQCNALTDLHFSARTQSVEEGAVQDCEILTTVCFEMENLAEVLHGGVLARLQGGVYVRVLPDAPEADIQRAGNCVYWGSDTSLFVQVDSCPREIPAMPDVQALLDATKATPDVATPLPAPQPQFDPAEFADYLGLWYAATMEMDGEVYDLGQLGATMSITINDDGTAQLDEEGNISTSTWTGSEDGVVLDGAPLTLQDDGKLRYEQYGTVMLLTREQPVFTGPSAEDLITYADYLGTWYCVSMTEGGETMNPAEFGAIPTLIVGDDGSLSIDFFGDVETMFWAPAEESIAIPGMRMTLQADGTLLCADPDGMELIFSREMPDVLDAPITDPDPIPEPAPAPAPDLEPVPEPVPEPAPAPSAASRMETLYVCTQYEAQGYTLPASTLTVEYSLLFHDNGTMKFVMAGVELDNLPWTQRTETTENGPVDAYVINYYGMELVALCTDDGFSLNFMDTMTLFFEPET